jgi:hypothetical protein
MFLFLLKITLFIYFNSFIELIEISHMWLFPFLFLLFFLKLIALISTHRVSLHLVCLVEVLGLPPFAPLVSPTVFYIFKFTYPFSWISFFFL